MENFQYKLGLEKTEEPEIKLPTSIGKRKRISIRKSKRIKKKKKLLLH